MALMHRQILGSGRVALLLVFAADAALAQASLPLRCRAASVESVERFISADCSACWSATPERAAAEGQWPFDWIVPSSHGEDAPLSPAAPVEARERVQRATGRALADGASEVHRSQAARAVAPRLRVQSSPAWNGYYALRLEVRGKAPRAASAWLALVEAVPAGTDGTPVARDLVRVVAGPLDLADLRRSGRASALHALRWPETSKAERLRARAWIEAADGTLLAVTDESCNRR